jgi:hypothetical protein
MNRLLFLALATTALAGCGTSAGPASPAPVTAPAATAPASPPRPDVASAKADQPDRTTTAAPATTPPAATPGSFRDLAARYVESDGSGGWRINELAATELEKLDGEQVVQLVPLLSDRDVQVRRGAAFFLLSQFNPNEPPLVAAFSKLLADSDATVRGLGLSVVRQMRGADQVAAAPALAEMLDPARESKPENRASIARLLGSLKSQAAGQGDQLAVAALDDPDPQVRSACLVAVASVAPPDETVAIMAFGLADQEASVRLVAAVRLRQLGADSAPATKQLAAALEDADPRVSDAAAQSLVNIGKEAVAAIAGKLGSPSTQVRKLALACLIKIGPGAASAAPAVEKCLQDPDPQVKQLAAAALAKIKP